jgi:hypothetical protein
MSLGAYIFFLLFCVFSPKGFAHEVRPAYLELQQTGAETYNLLWKVPARGEDLRLGIYVKLPPACKNVSEPRTFFPGMRLRITGA